MRLGETIYRKAFDRDLAGASTWIGGAGNRVEPHARVIPLRRRAEQAPVLATELRRAFVPHTPGGAARVQVFVQHQLPRFLQTQLLLVLQRTHAGEGAKVLPEGRWAHVSAIRQIIPLQRLREILLEPGHHFCDLPIWRPRDDEVTQLPAGRPVSRRTVISC
jgi:hypothetical protein